MEKGLACLVEILGLKIGCDLEDLMGKDLGFLKDGKEEKFSEEDQTCFV